MKKFLTIFFPTEQMHLYKDVGRIPYCLAKQSNWQCALAYLDDKGIIKDEYFEHSVELIPIRSSQNKLILWFNIFKFIGAYGKKFDVVNFYHGGVMIYLMAFFFKSLNSKCKIYVKLDLNEADFKQIITPPIRSLFGNIRKIIGDWLSDILIDVYSVETQSFFKRMKQVAKYKEKLLYISNGFFIADAINKDVNKENIILTVGRIGAYEKNNELLIDAIAGIDQKKIQNWKVYFVGPVVDRGFTEYVECICREKPYLKQCFIFTNKISNRVDLYKIYAKSRVFCLTSRWESFGLVIPEAMYHKNYIITTDFPAAHDLTADGSVGIILPSEDVKALQNVLTGVLDGEIDLDWHGIEARRLVEEQFDWNIIVERLAKEL